MQNKRRESSLGGGKKKLKKSSKCLVLSKSTKLLLDRRNEALFGNLKGVCKILLSPATQKNVDCVIGVDIDNDRPWKYVAKETILNNILQHEEDSEFLPLQAEIQSFPNDKILIGSFGTNIDRSEFFYICLTRKAERKVNRIMSMNDNNTFVKVIQSLNRKANEWISFGSEEEVTNEKSLSTRESLEIHMTINFPVKKKKKFSLRLVNAESRDFAEFLPKNRSYDKNIYRKRIDTGLTCIAEKHDKETQTKQDVLVRKCTQCNYEYKLIVTNKVNENLSKYLNKIVNNIADILTFNIHINLFSYDIQNLKQELESVRIYKPIKICSFQDVFNCRNRKVSSISWNCLISGLVAASYNKYPLNFIDTSQPSYDQVYDTTFHSHLVLVWCYSDSIRPKLILHAEREVSVVSCCPYNAKIIVGGYKNGQIVIWDLLNRLEDVENIIILNAKQMATRSILIRHLLWYKFPLPALHIFPTLTSPKIFSHQSIVTDIQWIPPTFHISKYGKYVATSEDEEHIQFITSSIDDSFLLIWNLNTSLNIVQKKKLRTLSEYPKALIKDISPLNKFRDHFTPVFKLKIYNPENKKKIPVTKFLFNFGTYKYTPLNPETKSDIHKRTYFEFLKSESQFSFPQNFIISSAFGNLYTCSFEGNSYDQGFHINNEICNTEAFSTVHDGPIQNCEFNYYIKDILLTIGGSVFAIWNVTKMKEPIFWRKSNKRYLSGKWDNYHPCGILFARQDSYLELWDLLENTKTPVSVTKNRGCLLNYFINEEEKFHATKKTFLTTDSRGAMNILYISHHFHSYPNQIKDSKFLFQKLFLIKNNTKLFLKTLIKQFNLSSDTNEHENFKYDKESEEKKLSTIQLLGFDENNMAVNTQRKILLEKNKLNLKQIKKDKKKLEKIKHDEKVLQRKLNIYLENKEKIFKSKSCPIHKSIPFKQCKQTICPSYLISERENMKTEFIKKYNLIEKETLRFIKTKKFKFDFNWNTVIKNHKEEWSKASEIISYEHLLNSDFLRMDCFRHSSRP